ncbi:hypothetical protein HK104_009485 [Borealophlyctis nickersoniae]|nr:hypothetical protein HK104_009485 [Borealophlyctis nickersoniae]
MDITNDFFGLLRSRQRLESLGIVEGVSEPQNGVTPDALDQLSSRRILKRKRNPPKDEFTKEAYRILEQITQLRSYLLASRRVYLNMGRHVPSATSPLVFGAEEEVDSLDDHVRSGSSSALPLKAYKSMTDGQRDEFDMQIQVFVKGLLSKTEILTKLAASLASSKSPSTSFFASLTSNRERELQQQRLAEHHQSMIWLLQTRLMEVSNIQKDMQERRLQQKVQKQESFLHKRPASASSFSVSRQSSYVARGLSDSQKGGEGSHNLSIAQLTSSLAASLGGASTPGTPRTGRAKPGTDEFGISGSRASTPTSGRGTPTPNVDNEAPGEEESLELHLSPQEKMMLETENAALLAELESNLDQVRNATNSLQEIATLQGHLEHHLQTQQHTIDSLYEEAWKSTETVQSANAYLVRAQRNFGDTRLWVLLFLLIASGVLLFLDYYG